VVQKCSEIRFVITVSQKKKWWLHLQAQCAFTQIKFWSLAMTHRKLGLILILRALKYSVSFLKNQQSKLWHNSNNRIQRLTNAHKERKVLSQICVHIIT
jgi:hypothetical protein